MSRLDMNDEDLALTINLLLCTSESVGDGPLGTHPLGLVPSVTGK